MAQEDTVEVAARVEVADRGVEEALRIELEGGDDPALERKFGLGYPGDGDGLARCGRHASGSPLVGVAPRDGAAEVERVPEVLGQEVEGERRLGFEQAEREARRPHVDGRDGTVPQRAESLHETVIGLGLALPATSSAHCLSRTWNGLTLSSAGGILRTVGSPGRACDLCQLSAFSDSTEDPSHDPGASWFTPAPAPPPDRRGPVLD